MLSDTVTLGVFSGSAGSHAAGPGTAGVGPGVTPVSPPVVAEPPARAVALTLDSASQRLSESESEPESLRIAMHYLLSRVASAPGSSLSSS